MKAEKKKVTAKLQLHSDQGFQYTSQGYFDPTTEYGITPSISRRGNCYNNAMAENFFSIIKTECIYYQKSEFFSIPENSFTILSTSTTTRISSGSLERRRLHNISLQNSKLPTKDLFVLSAQYGSSSP